MKKFFPHILILAIVVGVLIPTETANAQFGWFDFVPTPSDLLSGLITAISIPLLALFSFITWLSGQLLNFTLNYTIIDLKYNLDKLTGINTAWKVVRDLMNIAFIFMLIYEGIMLIIGQGNTQQLKKFIIGIVLASILINFSLFFTKVMIDASNIVTVGFYKAILGTNANATAFTVPGAGISLQYGLSNPIVKNLGLTSIYSPGAPSIFDSGSDPITGALVRVGGSGVVLLITAFIFFAVSVMFIVRYVALIILLMLSPIAYMGMALPFMSDYSKQWWATFKGQLLFAPIYMIMTWVTLTLMSSANFTMPSTFTAVFDTGTRSPITSMGLLVNFSVIIGLLIASLIIAKSTATKGSALIGQATGKLSAFAGGAVFGGAAAIGRRTIGARYDRLANDQDLKDRAAAGDEKAKRQIERYRSIASNSFDARKVGAFEGLSKTAGMDFGKGTKGIPFMGDAKAGEGGYRKKMENRAKEEKEFIDSLKISDQEMEKRKAALRAQELEETELRKNQFENNPERQAKLAEDKKKQKDVIEKTQNEAEKIEKDVKDVEKKIKESETKIKDYQERLRNSIDIAERSSIQQTIDEENKRKKSLDQDISNLKKELQNNANTIKQAENQIENIQKDYEAERLSWISKKREDLIRAAGGQEEKKDGNRVIQKKIENGPTEQHRKNVESYANELSGRAERIEDKTRSKLSRLATRVRYGSAAENREAAAKVRSTNTKKSTKQVLEDLLKDEGSIPKESPKEETPPPVTEAPPTT